MISALFRLMLFFALGALVLGGAHTASAEAHVVSDCGDTGLDTQLRFKLRLAQERDNVVITFSCPGPIVLTDGVLPSIYLNVVIDGGNTIIVSGNNASRLFEVGSGGNLTLNNIMLTKGYSDGDGGAIYSIGALTINNSRFVDNQTTLRGNGGAIIAFGALTIHGSEFANNKSANGGAIYPTGVNAVATMTATDFHNNAAMATDYGWGGAIYASGGATVTIHGGALRANSARSGGAIFVYRVTDLTQLTIDQGSVLSGNSATTIGGGIANDNGIVTLTDSTLSRNIAESGGGIYSTNGLAVLTNATLNENTAGFSGGGLFNTGGDASLTNVTLSRNSAGIGGGVYNAPGDIILTNVTLAGNSADIGGGIYHEAGASILTNTLIEKGARGDNCFDVDGGAFSLSDDLSCRFGVGRDGINLFLGPLADNGGLTLTHMPRADSPAIDGGTGAGCPATDQRGVSRTAPGTGIACDVGAVEYQTPLPRVYLPLIDR